MATKKLCIGSNHDGAYTILKAWADTFILDLQVQQLNGPGVGVHYVIVRGREQDVDAAVQHMCNAFTVAGYDTLDLFCILPNEFEVFEVMAA